MQLGKSLVATLALIRASRAIQVVGPSATLTVSNAQLSPDGTVRDASVVNGAFPGPLITGTPFSTYALNVVNKLTDPDMHLGTSIHWHGFFQKNTTWADGPVGVSQCPIDSGNAFQYNFKAAGQTGTYWYHSHYSTQYCDGVRGPMVIYDPYDPAKWLYDVDDANTVITLADWYHLPSKQVPAPFFSDATLINGMGRAFANTQASPLAVVNVVKGKRYRLRIVNIACDPNYLFSIDKHPLTIIEVDGENHKPLVVDSLQIFSGQRYSVVLNANQTIGNYWIRAVPSNPAFDPTAATAYAGGINSAILRYANAAVANPATPSTIPALTNRLIESKLVPLTNAAAPGGASLNAADVFKINLNFQLVNGQFTVNGASHSTPDVPTLLQILNGVPPASLMPANNVIQLPKNRVIQISLPQTNIAAIGGPHPFHLHGHTFSVIKSAGQTTPNFINPPRRDVVSAGSTSDNVTIRFVTDNAGPWFLHCHIDWHLEAGLAVVFGEAYEDVAASNPVPTAWNNLCPAWGNKHEFEDDALASSRKITVENSRVRNPATS